MDGHENDADALNQSAAPETLTPTESPAPTSDATTSDTPISETTIEETSASEAPAGSAIFSGDDTRIETENLPETVQQTALSTAPAGAITPALRTESTVTGDLKIGDAPKKKKWPLIAMGVAVVVILLSIGGWALLGNSNSKPEEKPVYGVTDESRSLFNRYVNFLLDDEDSSDKPQLLDFLANEYTFLQPGAMFAEQIKLSDDPESARTYFNDLNSMYQQFSQAFFAPDEEEAAADYSRDALSNYFFEASKGSYFDLNRIVSLYIQDGKDSLVNMVDNALKSDSENRTIKSLLDARRKQIGLYIDALSQADQAGCLTDETLDLNCARSKFETAEREALELANSINNLETELRKEAITSLENIYFVFYPDEAVIEKENTR